MENRVAGRGKQKKLIKQEKHREGKQKLKNGCEHFHLLSSYPGSGDANLGAGLRISGRASPRALLGNTDWQFFTYNFQVAEGETTVELVCELRAAKGEAWFDRASLRIMRLR